MDVALADEAVQLGARPDRLLLHREVVPARLADVEGRMKSWGRRLKASDGLR